MCKQCKIKTQNLLKISLYNYTGLKQDFVKSKLQMSGIELQAIQFEVEFKIQSLTDNRNMSNSEVFNPRLIRNAWRNELVKMNYNTLATLQPPMRNRYMMDSRLKYFSEHQRIDGLFYSVEYNADRKSGYHIHLLINAYKLTKGFLGYALDLKPNQIPYYKPVDSKVKVASYVTKYMKDDQTFYNIY